MTIYGHFNSSEADSRTIAQIGEKVVWEASQMWLREYNADLDKFLDVFVEARTEEHSETYKLAGSGYLQERSGQAQSAATKGGSEWSVAYPLKDFGAQLAYTDIAYAYMTPKALQTHLETVRNQDRNTVRRQVIHALLSKNERTVKDEFKGDIVVKPLANGDTVVYPNLIGSDSGATDNHYITSGYAASAISDANNPFPTMVDDLEEHLGVVSDGLVVFANKSHTPKFKALADYVPVTTAHVRPGADTAQAVSLPSGLPGRTIAVVDRVILQQWDWMPVNYLLLVDLNQPRPLKMRVDPANTGLPRGLSLISKDANTPFQASHWRHRFGLGAGNRLNGVVMELTADATYDNPSGIA